MSTKFCKRCKTKKDHKEFYKNSKTLDGLHTYCKKCDKEIRKNNYDLMKNKIKNVPLVKVCNNCKITKNKEEFYKANTSLDELNKNCIECCKKINDFYLNRNRNKNEINNEISLKSLICSRCKKEKSVNEFNKNKTTRTGFHHRCKACTRETQKLYYSNYYERNEETVLKKMF